MRGVKCIMYVCMCVWRVPWCVMMLLVGAGDDGDGGGGGGDGCGMEK